MKKNMTKTQSGLLLIAIGILMNGGGRVVPLSSSVMGASLYVVWMVASLIIILFGVVRLISGAMKKKP